MSDVIYDGSVSTKRDNSNANVNSNSNANMNSESFTKATKKTTKKATVKKKAVKKTVEATTIKKGKNSEESIVPTEILEAVEAVMEADASTSGQVDSEVETETETEVELTEEQKKKLEFRLSAEGEKLLDNYIKLLKKYKEDLNNYQKKEDDLKIDTLRALMTQEEIVA